MRGNILPQNPNLFPSANAVYVDKDYSRLRTNGLLAYPDIRSACEAWDTGGPARMKFGTPSVSSPGVILIGVGTFTHSGTATLNTDFVSIVGQGSTSSIISGTLTSNANNSSLIGFTTSTGFNLGNFAGYAYDVVATSVVLNNFTGIFDSCTFYGGTGAVTFQSAPNATGTFKNCYIGASAGHGILVEAGSDGISIICIDCIFTENCTNYLYFNSNFYGKIINCIFLYGCLNGAILFDNHVKNYGQIINCLFTNGGYGVSKISSGGIISSSYVVSSAASINNVETGAMISNCRFIPGGSNIAIQSTSGAPIELTRTTLKKSDTSIPGSSVGSNISNLSYGAGSSNEEIKNSRIA